MSKSNKFGFAPVDAESTPSRRARSPGPMGAAVRDVAENVAEATEAKIEQRRRNAEDARAFRSANEDGLLLQRLPVGNIFTDALPRDRLDLDAVATSDEMEELKASIRARGQREPIEVFTDAEGRYQLKKGWRRLHALRQLLDETGDDAFASAIARVEVQASDRLARYIDMVEENVVREDLTFAEMAMVAIEAARDANVDEIDPASLVTRLYGALHKTKRSYIRAFVFLLTQLGESLRWPKAVSRNVGVDVARALRNSEQVSRLKARLEACADEAGQTRVLEEFLRAERSSSGGTHVAEPKQKFEFRVAGAKVTARDGECRIVSDENYAMIQKDRLEEAVRAFQEALQRPRAR